MKEDCFPGVQQEIEAQTAYTFPENKQLIN